MAPHATGPLVGREAELRTLWDQVPASAERGLRIVVVRGPAGIGKSRLLAAFGERARDFGAAVIAGRSPAVGTLPYGALADALSAYARTSVSAAVQLRRAGDALVRLVPSVAALQNLEPAPLDRMAAVQAAFQLVRGITERRPLVMIVDDAHAADAETCELLGALTRHASDLPWTLAFGWRDPAQAVATVPRELVAGLRRDREVVDASLQPFEHAQTGALVSALLGDGLPAPSLVDMLQRRSAGNPYYVEQMLGWLRTTGRLQRTGIQWVAAAGAETLPPSIEEALSARLRALDDDAREVVQWLAVAGGSADTGLLEAASGLPGDALAAALQRLVDAGLVVDRGGRPPDHAVSHPLVAESAYGALAVARRRLAHRALAAVLTRQGAPIALVASHLTRAADVGDAEATAAAMAAGEDAESRLQYSQAVTWYQQALEIVGPTDATVRARVLDRLSELAMYVGDLQVGRGAIDELLAATPAEDRIRRATLLRRLGAVLGVAGDDAQARAVLDEGLGLASEAGPEAAGLLVELAMIALTTLPLDKAEAIIRRGHEAAAAAGEAAGDVAIALEAFDGLLTTMAGSPRQGLEGSLAAGRSAMAAGQVLPFGFAMFGAGIANVCLGQVGASAQSMTVLAESFSEDLGIMWGAVWGWAAAAEARAYLGDLDSALALSLRAEDIGRRHRALSALSYALGVGALVLVMRDERGAASSRLREARELLDAHPNLIAEALYWQAMSVLAEADGDSAAALEAQLRMARLAADRGHRWLLCLRAPMATLLVRAGRADEALTMARELRADVAGRDFPLAEVAAQEAMAVACVATGDLDAARTAADRALALVDALDAPLLNALVRLRLGAAFADSGDRGRAVPMLREAHERLSAMGALAPRDEARRRLRDLGVFATVVSVGPGRETAAAAPGHPLDVLTEREREVARLAREGMSSRAIALRLCISERTVENHLQRTYAKLGLHSRAELIALLSGTRPHGETAAR